METILLSNIIDNIHKHNRNETVYLIINWPCGFGSALIAFLENMYKLKDYNIHLFPYWINNSNNFKYSVDNICSFNVFFNDKLNIKDYIHMKKIFVISDIAVVNGYSLIHNDFFVNNMKDMFDSRFQINNNIINIYNDLFNSEYVFTIHLRSNFQKNRHDPDNIQDITNICNKLQSIYNNNSIPFIATDVKEYLDIFLKYFPLSHYNKDSFRIDNDKYDSMPLVSIPHTKYGVEIMLDIIGLSKGKNIYLSNSNISICVKMIYNQQDSNIINIMDI